ncbi:uncharacterized protein P884DRAFT_236451 [Thermothelomyces heterothallicus CBS 202.75]|uniref:uncharacterized protein n=1 Tax=Thermothelomyces heterothallicus CBS 202.75 TaxID=1149848 RepID=UPI0037442AFA
MADEPPLPPLPPLQAGGRKKRSRRPDSPPPPPHSSSSDPAFFSSDDDPAIDNYQTLGRRKRRYVGTWYDQQPASSDSALGDETQPRNPPPRGAKPPKPQKREFRRQLDSGVWMGTEGSVTDTDDGFDLEPAAARLPLAAPRPRVTAMPPPSVRPRLSPLEQRVQDAIDFCVETGTEQVDLSGMDLETIPDHQIRSLSNIVPIPHVTRDVAFEQREPEIQLFLSNNRLRRFPVALVNVENITVLSLRANRLVTLPPAIAKLVNLETLNIAQNFLNFLPGELLALLRRGGKMRNFAFEPNRFWQPQATAAAAAAANPQHAAEYERLTFPGRPAEAKPQPTWSGVTTELYARTPVHFLDSALNGCTPFTLPPSLYNPAAPSPEKSQAREQGENPAAPLLKIEPFTALATPTKPIYRDVMLLAADPHRRRTSSGARGPRSLFELALRACATASIAATAAAAAGRDDDDDDDAHDRQHHLAGRRADLVPSWMPRYFARAVQRAVDIRREGGASCAVCGRDTAMPLALWVEFRRVGRAAAAVGGEGADNDGPEGQGRGGGGEAGEVTAGASAAAAARAGFPSAAAGMGTGAEGGGMVLVPFLRVACSWACVPVKVGEVRTEREEEGEV